MIYPAPDKLDAVGSKYALVIVAAKRARQIKDKARTFVEKRTTNPLTTALEEIAEGKITLVRTGEPEVMPSSTASTPILAAFVGVELDDDLVDERMPDTADVLLGGAEDLEAYRPPVGDDDEDETDDDETSMGVGPDPYTTAGEAAEDETGEDASDDDGEGDEPGADDAEPEATGSDD